MLVNRRRRTTSKLDRSVLTERSTEPDTAPSDAQPIRRVGARGWDVDNRRQVGDGTEPSSHLRDRTHRCDVRWLALTGRRCQRGRRQARCPRQSRTGGRADNADCVRSREQASNRRTTTESALDPADVLGWARLDDWRADLTAPTEGERNAGGCGVAVAAQASAGATSSR
jgi:hypothetical protein